MLGGVPVGTLRTFFKRNAVGALIFETHCFAGSKTGRHEVTPEGDEARMASSDADYL
jgi:hypothetical protein